jgi:hypothetical protein
LHGLAVNFNNLGEDGGTYLVGKLDQRRVEAEAAMAVTSSSNPNNDPASSSSDAADSDPDENTLASRRWLKNPNKWGVCLLDLTSTASTDAVLVAVAEYAVRDRWMRYLYAEDNRITVSNPDSGILY